MKEWLHQTSTSKGYMDSIALLSKALHLQPAKLLIEHEANKALLNWELSSREMECFVSGIILQRKYAPSNSDSVESVSVHQEFGWGTKVLQLSFGISCAVALTETLQYSLARGSLNSLAVRGYWCCVADTSTIGSAKKFCFKRLKPFLPLRGGSSGLDRIPCVKLDKKYKTELAIDINTDEYTDK